MTSNDNRNIRSAGFTLIELMVVLIILAIGLLPLALVQTRAQQDVFESGQFSDAVQIAQLQMESAKSLGFGNIVAGVAATRTDTDKPLKIAQIGIRDTFGESGKPWELMKLFGLTAEDIAKKALEMLG